ncbi:unnamed protein product, partial [Sphacelaria rigidula]
TKFRKVWLHATDSQVAGSERNTTWSVVDSSEEDEAVDSKSLFRWDTERLAYVVNAKARLLSSGEYQEMGGYNDVLAYSSQGYPVFHFDVQQGFVQFDLKGEACMTFPAGLGERFGTAKTKYGLRQAAREWLAKLGSTLKVLGYERRLADTCICKLMDGEELKVLVVAHVDDMLVMCDEGESIKLAEALNTHFPTKNLGEVVLYAGV